MMEWNWRPEEEEEEGERGCSRVPRRAAVCWGGEDGGLMKEAQYSGKEKGKGKGRGRGKGAVYLLRSS